MSENNSIFQQNPNPQNSPNSKPTHVGALVLGILSIVFGLLIALIGDILAIIGIILSVVKRPTHNTKSALICSIVGLGLSILNHILGALLMFYLLG